MKRALLFLAVATLHAEDPKPSFEHVTAVTHGDVIVERHRASEGTEQIWLVSTADPAKRHLLYTHHRQADIVLSDDDAWLMSVGSVPAAEEPDWKSIAEDAQPALVRLNTTVGNYLIHNTGFFVSQHGHLVCNLGAIANATRPPEFLDSQGKTLPFGSITAVFPDAQIVILKLDHHPKKWLVLSNQPVQSGTEVAFLGPIPLRAGSYQAEPLGGMYCPEREDLQTGDSLPETMIEMGSERACHLFPFSLSR